MRNLQPYLMIVPVLLLAVLIPVYYYVSPFTHLFPGCALYESTGLYCPACGGQRAFSDILHRHFAAALHNNLLFVAGIPVLIFGYYRYLFLKGRKDLSLPNFSSRFSLILLFVVLLFWILRNLPAFSWLAPYSH